MKKVAKTEVRCWVKEYERWQRRYCEGRERTSHWPFRQLERPLPIPTIIGKGYRRFFLMAALRSTTMPPNETSALRHRQKEFLVCLYTNRR